jgi:alpha/beta superfamily hydrolase
MKKQYFLLKTIRLIITLLMVIILGILLLFIYKKMTSEANVYSSFPSIINLLYLMLYIPILIAGIWCLGRINKKLKVLFPEKYPPRGPITKKRLFKIILKTAIIFALTIITILFIAPFGIIYVATNHHVYYRNDSLLQMTYTASDFNLNENILSLETEDNIKIWASEITVKNPNAIVIFLTGIEQPSITQFYPHAKLLRNNGYASILLEVRGHGKSGGNKICLGYDEILDVKATIDYKKSKNEYKNIPIVIQGVSMGGAVAINAFGQYKEINALIAMSAYTTFEDVVIDNLEYYKVPKFLCTIEKPLFKLALDANFSVDKVNNMNPITQIQNSNNRSILLIASSGDTSVPVDNTKKLYSVSKNADLWIRDSWEHFIVKDCILVNVADDKEYCNKILGFLKKVCDDNLQN